LHLLKRILSILCLVLFVVTATEFNQLFKFNTFIEHYKEHKAQDESLSLLKFLDIHYGHGNVLDEDFEKDMKLPFKTTTSDFSSSQIISQVSIQFSPTFLVEFHEQSVFALWNTFLTPSYLSAIWQPPRFA